MRAHVSIIPGAALVLAVAAAAADPFPAEAAKLRFAPRADAAVDRRAPARTYGRSKSLRADGAPRARSYLRFRLDGFDAPVLGAKLRLRSRRRSGRIDVREVGGRDWSEGRITYRNAPRLGRRVGRSKRSRRGRWVGIDVTSAVRGPGVLELALATRSPRARRFASRESAAGSPRLVVETAPSSVPTIAAAGDIACDPASSAFNGGLGTATACRQRYTSDLLVGRRLAAVLPLGDLQYEDGTLAKFGASYDPSWGRVKHITRPVPGNHEYLTPAASGYFDYFNGVSAPAGAAGARGSGYYSFDLGAWHLVALNSSCDAVGGCGEGSPQNAWLEADLAAHGGGCLLAYWHAPRFGSGSYGGDASVAPLWDDLYAAGADVVLNGHHHHYERFAPQSPSGAPDRNGIRQFIVGTGGKSLRPVGAGSSNSQVREDGVFGVLALALGRDRYDWRFVPEAGAAFTDSGSHSC